MFCSAPVLLWNFPKILKSTVLVSVETLRNYTKLLQYSLWKAQLETRLKKNPSNVLVLWKEKNWVEAEYTSENHSEYNRPFFQITVFTKHYITLLPSNHSSPSYLWNLKMKIYHSSLWHQICLFFFFIFLMFLENLLSLCYISWVMIQLLVHQQHLNME